MLRHYTIISGVNFFYFGLASTAQKMKFFIKDSVTFTEEILNGKFHFLYSEGEKSNIKQLLHASGY